MRYPPTPKPSRTPQPVKQTLADLRPKAMVDCLNGHSAPAVGAVKFHSLFVCAECAAKLKLKAA